MKQLIQKRLNRWKKSFLAISLIQRLIGLAPIRLFIQNKKARRAFAFFWMSKNIVFYAYLFRNSISNYASKVFNTGYNAFEILIQGFSFTV